MLDHNGQKYRVTKSGEVFGNRGHKLATSLSHDGYVKVTLGVSPKRSPTSVHRLVAKQYIPNLLGYKTVDHIDCNKLNNHKDNLRWISRVLNVKKAQDEPCVALRGSFGLWFPCQNDAEVLGFQQGNISNVIHGKRNTHKGFTWLKMEKVKIYEE